MARTSNKNNPYVYHEPELTIEMLFSNSVTNQFQHDPSPTTGPNAYSAIADTKDTAENGENEADGDIDIQDTLLWAFMLSVVNTMHGLPSDTPPGTMLVNSNKYIGEMGDHKTGAKEVTRLSKDVTASTMLVLNAIHEMVESSTFDMMSSIMDQISEVLIKTPPDAMNASDDNVRKFISDITNCVQPILSSEWEWIADPSITPFINRSNDYSQDEVDWERLAHIFICSAIECMLLTLMAEDSSDDSPDDSPDNISNI